LQGDPGRPEHSFDFGFVILQDDVELPPSALPKPVFSMTTQTAEGHLPS
jgi:hypothetical protein